MGKVNRSYLENMGIFTAFVLIIALFYIQHPIQGSLFGNLDSWANLALFHELDNFLKTGLNTDSSSFLFPSKAPWMLYGLDFLTGFIWVFFKHLGLSDLWAYYAYIVSLLSLNSLALFLWGKRMFISKKTAFFVALLFSVNPILYETLINPNVISYFFFFLAAASLMDYRKNGQIKNLAYAVLFSSLQIYLSPIVFLFSAIFLVVLALSAFKVLLRTQALYLLLFLVIHLLLISPFLYWYVLDSQECANMYTHFGNSAKEAFDLYLSLDFADFFRFYPLSDINETFRTYDSNALPIVSLKNLSFGLVLFVFFLVGLTVVLKRRIQPWLVVVLILCILFGVGKYLVVTDDFILRNPFYPIIEYSGFYEFMRVPSRFGLPIYLLLILITFLGLEDLFRRVQSAAKHSLYLVVCLLFFIEPLFIHSKVNSTEQGYFDLSLTLQDIQDMFSADDLILFLPSGLFYHYLDTREYVYMLMNAKLELRTVNGSAFCIPSERMQLFTLLENEDLTIEDFCSMLLQRDIDKIVFQDRYMYNDQDTKQAELLGNSPCVHEVLQLDNIIVYSTN